MASFPVSILTWDQLRRVAEGYLARNHPSGSIPIPIEEIVDLIEKIDVVEMEDLSVDGPRGLYSKG
jgi:hypothetical protein